MDRSLLDYRPEIAADASPAARLERQAALSRSDEMEDAAELLERIHQGQLEGYLVELLDRAGLPATRPVAPALSAILGGAARQLLRPGGGRRTAAAGRVFGLELEGLSAEDQVFEVARHFVRYATRAAELAGRAPGAGTPQVVAQRAAAAAAPTLAPGLLPWVAGALRPSGFWFRRGRHLIVLNP